MEIIGNILKDINNWYQFIAFVLLVIVLLVKWLVIDRKKEKYLSTTSTTVESLGNMMNRQNELLKILIRRYSDNLSQEQINPVINWLYQSFEFTYYIKYISISKKLENNRISHEEAKKELKENIENIFNEFYQWLNLFKYKGNTLCKYWDKNDVTFFYDISVLEISKKFDVERTLDTFERTIRKQIIKIVDKIQKDEDISS